MSTKNSKVNCQKHYRSAVKFFHSGDYRGSANEYLLAFILSSQMDRKRWQIFHGYTSILSELYFKPSVNDIIALKQIIQDKLELKLYRVQAGFTYGLVNFDIGNRVDAAEGYREAIRMGEKIMKRSDENVSVISFTLNSRLDGTPVQHNTPMKEIVSEILEKCYRNLKQLRNDMKYEEYKRPQVQSNGTIMPESRKTYIFPHMKISRMKEDDFHCLLAIGGSCCDCCKKKVSDTVILSSCAKCKMAFYCSKECQMKQWKLGHRKFCRKPRQFQEGDFV